MKKKSQNFLKKKVFLSFKKLKSQKIERFVKIQKLKKEKKNFLLKKVFQSFRIFLSINEKFINNKKKIKAQHFFSSKAHFFWL